MSAFKALAVSVILTAAIAPSLYFGYWYLILIAIPGVRNNIKAKRLNIRWHYCLQNGSFVIGCKDDDKVLRHIITIKELFAKRQSLADIFDGGCRVLEKRAAAEKAGRR